MTTRPRKRKVDFVIVTDNRLFRIGWSFDKIKNIHDSHILPAGKVSSDQVAGQNNLLTLPSTAGTFDQLNLVIVPLTE